MDTNNKKKIFYSSPAKVRFLSPMFAQAKQTQEIDTIEVTQNVEKIMQAVDLEDRRI